MTFDFDALFQSESERFLVALDAADPSAAVPTCPEWTADDLLWHLGEVQHFWAAIVGGRMLDPSEYEQPSRPAADGLRPFFVESHKALVQALAEAEDSDPAWSWFAPDQTAGFTRRRQVHEALIHRVDAELAAGADSSIDPALAADGVDEVLRIMLGGAPDWAEVTEQGPIGTIRCTDVDRQWLIQVQTFRGLSPNTGTNYTDEPILAVIESGDPVFDVAGAAPDLDRWIWNRLPPGPVELSGNSSAFEAMIAEGLQ